MNRIATFYAGILLTCSVTAYSLFSCKYATQKPPKKDQAQKYYNKAVKLGSEPNKKLEELIK